MKQVYLDTLEEMADKLVAATGVRPTIGLWNLTEEQINRVQAAGWQYMRYNFTYSCLQGSNDCQQWENVPEKVLGEAI